MLAIDTECTGLDWHHGARPFIVTTMDERQTWRTWVWDVDPFDRSVTVPPEDVEQIRALLDEHGWEVCGHHLKFDMHMLAGAQVISFDEARLLLSRCQDTTMSGHILASNLPRNLTDECKRWLDHDISPLEQALREAVMECRQFVWSQQTKESAPRERQLELVYDEASGNLTYSAESITAVAEENPWDLWRLAKEGLPEMPSIDKEAWRADYWLPRALAKHLWESSLESVRLDKRKARRSSTWEYRPPGTDGGDDPGHPWWTIAQRYADGDSEANLPLWLVHKREIERRELWAIYRERIKLLPVAFEMEERGATLSEAETETLIDEYSAEVEASQAECLEIARRMNFDLDLPAGASPNDSLREFFWGSVRLTCPRCGTERKHKQWQDGPLDESDGQTTCQKCLKRKREPAAVRCSVNRNRCLGLEVQFNDGAPTLNKEAMAHYEAVLEPGPALDFVKTLSGVRSRQTAATYARSYRSYWLPVGDHLPGWHRLHGSFNPTATAHLRWSSSNPNMQNISKKEDFTLRRCFGPSPDREWWSMDGKNLELRIPAYEAGETELVWVFDHPDDPPYFGSYHLVVFDALHPELFKQHGKAVKDLFESTWYQWVKNMNFAIIYGCQKVKADATAHVAGAYDMVARRFPKIAALAEKYKRTAERLGRVETIPDRRVDAGKGYPILAGRTDDGRISPTTPLNYHVSGTAMQWTNRAMVETDQQLKEWQGEGWDGFMTLQVHDELVFDMPRGIGAEPWKTNLPRARRLKQLMEDGGAGIGVPTPVSMEWHDVSWATGRGV
jgi:DNA polymerase I-like protein with 3'-5' exonuclease and polymerase domains